MSTATTTIPPEIAALNFDHLGCHWLDPRRAKLHPGELDERPRCHKRLAAFMKAEGVKPFREGYKNLFALLLQGGASTENVKTTLERFFLSSKGMIMNRYGLGSPFDHLELWGRQRTPLYLIGHPYHLEGDAMATLDAIRRLGMSVRVDAYGWYGYESIHVRVCHYATVEALKEPRP